MAVGNKREEVDRDSKSVSEVESTGFGQLPCHRERREGSWIKIKTQVSGLGYSGSHSVRSETLDLERAEEGTMIVCFKCVDFERSMSS